MSEQFAQLFEESIRNSQVQVGNIVRGKIVDIAQGYVVVNAGLKSEAVIPEEEFLNSQGKLEVKIGDSVDVALDTLEDGFGETRLSRERAKRAETWQELARVSEAGEVVLGIISGKVKGGFTVEIKNVRAFLPGSLVDVRPVRDLSYLEGKEIEFKVIKLDQKRNNIVVSRRAVIETEGSAEREALLDSLEEGQEAKGVVKNLTDYGAFIDLGGIDGLLHITDMSWKRVKHPSEVVNVGDEIMVKILKFDKERNRVSLGLKQLAGDPWFDIAQRYPVNSRLHGKVTNITDYGCFVEIEEGIEGLVHVSEMDWTNKNIHPSKVVQVGDEVDVMVLDIDGERRRISLGVKQCTANPWEAFNAAHEKGEHIRGKIKSITDFGVFIGLEGDIDGLVHLSDISWREAPEEAIRRYNKGEEIETVILSIDAERERISLGIKQLEEDAFGLYADKYPKGTLVTGKIIEVTAKHATIELAEEVQGQLKASEVSRAKVDDMQEQFRVGDEVETKIINVDRKNRIMQLSIKAKEQGSADAGGSDDAAPPSTTLGDLLKAKMGGMQEG
jgi:small subunit ribosomal protein S1